MTQTTHNKDAFASALDAEVRTWKPRDPDSGSPNPLKGTYIGFEIRDDTEYEPYPVITVRDDDGTEWMVQARHTVLKSELVRHQPRPGERIGIRYAGAQKSTSGREYEGYRVVVDRPEADTPQPSWEDPRLSGPRHSPTTSTKSPYDANASSAWDAGNSDTPPF